LNQPIQTVAVLRVMGDGAPELEDEPLAVALGDEAQLFADEGAVPESVSIGELAIPANQLVLR
jgi:hypothetical protein